jgi:excisionase family DNA binding protein
MTPTTATQTPTQPTTTRLLLTASEAANALAVSERTLWSLTKRGEIGSIRIGRSIRYDLEQLRLWIASKSQPPTATATAAELN